jgi:microcystin-dependent protein
MPAQRHEMRVHGATSNSEKPNNQLLGRASEGTTYADTANGRALTPGAIRRSGGGQPHENRPPHLILSYCIALQGNFPARE